MELSGREAPLELRGSAWFPHARRFFVASFLGNRRLESSAAPLKCTCAADRLLLRSESREQLVHLPQSRNNLPNDLQLVLWVGRLLCLDGR